MTLSRKYPSECNLIGFDETRNFVALIVCTKITESKLAEQETRQVVILPPRVDVQCSLFLNMFTVISSVKIDRAVYIDSLTMMWLA